MNQGFSYYFCLMIEGSGSVLVTNGSGRPENIRILRIRMRIQFPTLVGIDVLRVTVLPYYLTIWSA
jgi:hypothetical protein